MNSASVTAVLEAKTIPTYGLGEPERNPMFFEKRVYQGSCGSVYPVPFIDRVLQDEPPNPVQYRVARLENEFVRLEMLPEIGGRIFVGQDKSNDDYDFFYRQDVIKPALVGLAGPWISGGVEFNWPQHHRPSTFMPTDVFIEEESDGARTIWFSEHDPLNRMKGMHGIRLRPNSALIELRGRLYNRTPITRTFLWWANVAAKVHERYQSFFPPDVHYVADHAVRAMSSFPIARNDYYGIDYAAREGANDLSWYKNIPVPTSYMICETAFDFFGGYDYKAHGGFVHVADRHISPGKKQWTWGNDEFGWAWDRELTDRNGPYVELMAGVYTDNQPDFSYLLPYETKTFSQFWWPYQELGPVQQANERLALRLMVDPEAKTLKVGVAAASPVEGALVLLTEGDQTVLRETLALLSPDAPWRRSNVSFAGSDERALLLRVFDQQGGLLIEYRPVDIRSAKRSRDLATEPPEPEDIQSGDELYLTGEHLEQYRHPTRLPEAYWEEAIRRDPEDARCRTAMGRQALSRGAFGKAERHLRRAIKRYTFSHPNPVDGEAHYLLGLALKFRQSADEAYELLYKATWNGAWRSPAFFTLACLDAARGDYSKALTHAEQALRANQEHNKSYALKAICLRKIGRKQEAEVALQGLLAMDPLDHWAGAELRALREGKAGLRGSSRNDAQTALDVAFDYSDAGGYAEAAQLLENHHSAEVVPVAVPNPLERTPMTLYALAWIYDALGEPEKSRNALEQARNSAPDYLFPSRLHEQVVLEWAISQPGKDRNAAFALGNYAYDKKRRETAIERWEMARAHDSAFPTVHRNLGIAYWNVYRDGERARKSYQRAVACDPLDARLLAEYDQLRAKLTDSPAERLLDLEAKIGLAQERDDATVQLVTLYNQTGAPEKALNLLLNRSFHPWEGGEGKVLRQYTRARLLLGQRAMHGGEYEEALEHFQKATQTPDNLGEKYHPLQAKADVLYWQGKALRALKREHEAIQRFAQAAEESGDFQKMAVTAFSEMTTFKALALMELGRAEAASAVLTAMKQYAEQEMRLPARIDYFATSLPNLLVFEEDIEEEKNRRMETLIEYANKGLDRLSGKRHQ